MSAVSLADRLDDEISRSGPIRVARYIDAALYDPDGGFYSGQGRAGRDGDFLTAPEVGPLFGAVLARALDAWWDELGRPAPFPVIEWGAGPGTLARSVIAAEPEVLRRGALQWHLIERSAVQRAAHPVHEAVQSFAAVDDALGPATITGVVLANELLDNLPFDIVERRDGLWQLQCIGPRDAAGRFQLGPSPTAEARDTGQTILDALIVDASEGTTLPWQPAARQWLASALQRVDIGRVIVFDYGASTAALAARNGGWLRTHRAHEGSADWRADPGACDITADVDFEQLQLDHPADHERAQADWLRAHGIDGLVAEGRRIWGKSAAVGDLTALRARSRIRESEALLDPDGMGAFRVLEWIVSPERR
jgi:SAM-dependent MidA family methyltransferase